MVSRGVLGLHAQEAETWKLSNALPASVGARKFGRVFQDFVDEGSAAPRRTL
jgi:hypothetical protein